MKLEHAWDHNKIATYLFMIFRRDENDLLLKAAADETKRWNLRFVLGYANINEERTGFGGTVNYDKRQRRFNYIEYSDRRNWAVRISIRAGCYYSAWEFRDFLYHHVPEAFHPEKKLSKWLLTN